MGGYGIDDVPMLNWTKDDVVALADAENAAQVALMAEAVIRVE